MERTAEEEAEVKAMQDEILKPPPSAWSDEPPKEQSGFFWLRSSEKDVDPALVFVTSLGQVEWFGTDFTPRVETYRGQWQPVAPPLA